MHTVTSDTVEVRKWFPGINKYCKIYVVLKIHNQDRTRNDGFNLQKFRLIKEVPKLIWEY